MFSINSVNAVINVVAAENFYGNVAELIGGNKVKVKSIIDNSNIDPHAFTELTTTATMVSKAQVVIFNGYDYDWWMQKLLQNNAQKSKIHIIKISDIVQHQSNNPHLWYMPSTFTELAKELKKTFANIEPQHEEYFNENLNNFIHEFDTIHKMVKKNKRKAC